MITKTEGDVIWVKRRAQRENRCSEIKRESYKRYAESMSPRSPVIKNSLRAFVVGGGICCIGEGLRRLYGGALGLSERDTGITCAVTLVFVAALLTGVGVFDNIARWAGAGTLVPITGFANAVASSAMDSRSEGLVLGVGAKIFTVAGPVLLYGTLAGSMYGVIYFLVLLIGGS